MKAAIMVLDDLIDFFESSLAFIAVACEKLRKMHGKAFNVGTVKALLNLKTNLSNDEKKEAIVVCLHVLKTYKTYKGEEENQRGVFQDLDTREAEAAFEQEQQEKNPEKVATEDLEDSVGEDAMEDFLREGGINEVEEGKVEEEEKEPELKRLGTQIFNTNPDLNMCGFLNKTTINMGEED